MFASYTRPRYQVSVYRTVGPLVYTFFTDFFFFLNLDWRREKKPEDQWSCERSYDILV